MTTKVLDQSTVDALVSARNATEAWACILEVTKNYGFDYVMFGSNRLRRAGVFGERSNSFFLSDMPPDVMYQIWEKEMYKTITVAIWAMQNEGTMSFEYGSKLYHSDQLPDDQKATQEFLMEAGITSGYIIGFNTPQTSVATAFTLINCGRSQEETDAVWAEHGDTIKSYASLFNLRMGSLPIPSQQTALTNRQKEVLHWAAHGKTSAEVATILGLASATIEKHLRQARESLGVSTTTQAVLFAQINNHIFTGRN